METEGKICPKCKTNLTISLVKDTTNFHCQCGYGEQLKVEDYLANYCKNKTVNNPKAESLLKKGNDFLESYFKELYNKKINELKESIKLLEAAYEESHKRNKNILSLLQILEENSKNTNEYLYLYKCADENDIKQVIKFYKDYYINWKEIDQSKLTECKRITDHTKPVNCIVRLKDGRVATCSNTIRIYDLSNDYHCDQVIDRHNETITSICQLDDGTIVSSGNDFSITIGDHTIKNAHEKFIPKVLTLPNNRIASCSYDDTIKIWKSDPPYSDTPIKVLTVSMPYSIIYIKEKDILVSSGGKLTFWNMTTYQVINENNEVKSSNSCLSQIDKDRILAGDFHEFWIVNINKYEVEKHVYDSYFGKVTSAMKMRDNKTIFITAISDWFIFYDLETKKYTLTRQVHVKNAIALDGETFMTSSDSTNYDIPSSEFDTAVRIWKY